MTALATSPNAMLRVTIDADQVDTDTSNNSIALPFQIDDGSFTEVPPTPDTGEEGNSGADSTQPDATERETTSSSSSGGGASIALGLILLATLGLRRRYGRAWFYVY